MTHLRSLQVPVIHKGLSLMKSNLHSWTSSNLHSFQIALESVCQGFSEERHTMVWKWAVDLHNVFISFALIFLEYLSKSSISLHELIRCGGNICVAARRASSLFPLVSHFCVVRLSQCLRTAPTAWTNSWLDDVFELWRDCQTSISKSSNSERRQTQDVRELLTHVVHMYEEILQLVAVALTVAAFLINDFKRFSPSHTFKREQQRDFYIQHSVNVRSKINVISLVFKQSLRALAAWQLLGLSRPLAFQVCLLWFCVLCLYL